MSRIRRWLSPHPILRWAVVISAALLLTLCLNGTIAIPAVSYFAYLYSTYALVIFCMWLPDVFRHGNSGAIRLLERVSGKYPRLAGVDEIVRDPERRTRALLLPSLILNLGYAVFKLAVGASIGSEWMIGIGVYYAVLAGLRFALLRTFLAGGSDVEREWRAYRNAAAQLLLLTLAMTGLIVFLCIFAFVMIGPKYLPLDLSEQDKVFMAKIKSGVQEHMDEIDDALAKYVVGWQPERLAKVDRSILRLAVYELLFTDVPPSVVVNEAVNMAGVFSSDESTAFVNGILGNFVRDYLAREKA